MRRYLPISALAKIPMRYRISGAATVVTLILWLLSLGHFEHYFKFMHTQIGLAGGQLRWVGPLPYVFNYDMSRPLFSSILLVVCVALYPLLCTGVGVSVLAILLNFLTCGLVIGNPFGALCVFIFDIGLLGLAVQGFATLFAMRRDHPVIGFHCSTCGYDLRATPLRCPECGTVVPTWRNNDLLLG